MRSSYQLVIRPPFVLLKTLGTALRFKLTELFELCVDIYVNWTSGFLKLNHSHYLSVALTTYFLGYPSGLVINRCNSPMATVRPTRHCKL